MLSSGPPLSPESPPPARVQLSAFWHQYHVNLVVPYKLRGHNVVTNIMVGGYAGVYYFDEFQVRGGAILAQFWRNYCAIR